MLPDHPCFCLSYRRGAKCCHERFSLPFRKQAAYSMLLLLPCAWQGI